MLQWHEMYVICVPARWRCSVRWGVEDSGRKIRSPECPGAGVRPRSTGRRPAAGPYCPSQLNAPTRPSARVPQTPSAPHPSTLRLVRGKRARALSIYSRDQSSPADLMGVVGDLALILLNLTFKYNVTLAWLSSTNIHVILANNVYLFWCTCRTINNKKLLYRNAKKYIFVVFLQLSLIHIDSFLSCLIHNLVTIS